MIRTSVQLRFPDCPQAIVLQEFQEADREAFNSGRMCSVRGIGKAGLMNRDVRWYKMAKKEKAKAGKKDNTPLKAAAVEVEKDSALQTESPKAVEEPVEVLPQAEPTEEVREEQTEAAEVQEEQVEAAEVR